MAIQKVKSGLIKVSELPPIPNKSYFNIAEAAVLCALEKHVLRYWEQVFQQLEPVKRRGNRRSYQPKDIQLIRRIRYLLYEECFTIEGAQAQLRSTNNKTHQNDYRALLKSTLLELESLLKIDGVV